MTSIISLIVPKIRFFFVYKKIRQPKLHSQSSLLVFGLAVAWRNHGACLLGRACW